MIQKEVFSVNPGTGAFVKQALKILVATGLPPAVRHSLFMNREMWEELVAAHHDFLTESGIARPTSPPTSFQLSYCALNRSPPGVQGLVATAVYSDSDFELTLTVDYNQIDWLGVLSWLKSTYFGGRLRELTVEQLAIPLLDHHVSVVLEHRS